MDQDQQEQKKHLEQQLQWTKERVCILDEMNVKLHEMKKIAEYAVEHTLSVIEIERLNGELDTLKNEFSSLEKQPYPILH
ncbi:hypothetical protein H7992_18750 [Sporosarcina sp. resist]|uniref:hypothetical protein n=1 Tax=Sporosarcina sp. resist TaxID=2762563 RepID=UPI00164E681B|nr:hypothetical protein [Sporosarcina sp. resist]QNK87226.1 hypothetical protein H7992_18750 [Sporosarcina sp. resist]